MDRMVEWRYSRFMRAMLGLLFFILTISAPDTPAEELPIALKVIAQTFHEDAKQGDPGYRFTPKEKFARWKTNLLVLADNGELSAMLEVAGRYETGKRLPRNQQVAHYWYRRALLSGGGKMAKMGAMRTHPHLSDWNLRMVEMWLENKIIPFD
ncbi:SEL1-like repeat protein [Magnetospira sp. QH-2]|uniref:SEL1-like repeat protein n=1 Tax=Magnetospira sp. (strain QH-2) TaxID=1288970 RepID=UPI0003E8127E|nr:SEL1-like repeat protein [Magnetospira sp. QH-2]CCQ72376.1 protein of unknown function [Magnetospira sp. QH-2]